MEAFMVVRSVVTDATARAAFDSWYRTGHMPLAIGVLGALEGWRLWSETDPAIHYAVYRFADRSVLEAVPMERRMTLRREYETAWPGVTRTREVLRRAEAG